MTLKKNLHPLWREMVYSSGKKRREGKEKAFSWGGKANAKSISWAGCEKEEKAWCSPGPRHRAEGKGRTAGKGGEKKQKNNKKK